MKKLALFLAFCGSALAQTSLLDINPNTAGSAVGVVNFWDQARTNKISLASPATLSADAVLTLPAPTGSPGCVQDPTGAGALVIASCGGLTPPVTLSGTTSGNILTVTQSGAGNAIDSNGTNVFSGTSPGAILNITQSGSGLAVLSNGPASFTGSSAGAMVHITQSGSGTALLLDGNLASNYIGSFQGEVSGGLTATSSTGVFGQSTTGYGVEGFASSTGIGVYGSNTSTGQGGFFLSNGGTGLFASSGSTVVGAGNFALQVNGPSTFGNGAETFNSAATFNSTVALNGGCGFTCVSTWNSRAGPVSLTKADVTAVEGQGLANIDSPTFSGLSVGGTVSLTPGSGINISGNFGLTTTCFGPVFFTYGVALSCSGSWSSYGPTFASLGINGIGTVIDSSANYLANSVKITGSLAGSGGVGLCIEPSGLVYRAPC